MVNLIWQDGSKRACDNVVKYAANNKLNHTTNTSHILLPLYSLHLHDTLFFSETLFKRIHLSRSKSPDESHHHEFVQSQRLQEVGDNVKLDLFRKT